MANYLTEQEQVELLKGFIKQYSMMIVLGILFAGLAIFLWRTYQERENRLDNHASLIFDEMLSAKTEHDTNAMQFNADKLEKHYTKTVYRSFAALLLANDAIARKNYLEAEKQLNWVIYKSHTVPLKQIARLRLARVYIANQHPEKALQLLNKTDDSHFEGLIDEVKGDAYLSLHQSSVAKAWYQKALETLPEAANLHPLLQMKYDNL